MTFPPPFETKTPDGATIVVDDVDVLLRLAADYAGVPEKKLDRRRLEAALKSAGAPELYAERAVMVFLGRRRQRRLSDVARGARRIRALAGLLVVAFLVAAYAYRLEKRLAAKLDRVEAARTVYLRNKALADRAMARLEAAGLDADARESLEAGLDAAEDRSASARRRYDAIANDYIAAVRGFPTAPFARFVRLPPRVPMSWELTRDR